MMRCTVHRKSHTHDSYGLELRLRKQWIRGKIGENCIFIERNIIHYIIVIAPTHKFILVVAR